jgi:hypothetical protein
MYIKGLVLHGISLGLNVEKENSKRSLNDPKCFVKSYMDGREYSFSNIIDQSTGKTYDSIEKLAIDFGPAWQGHKLQCTDEPEGTTIINSFKENLIIQTKADNPESLVKRGVDNSILKSRQPKSIIESTKKSPTCLPLVSENPGLNPYHPLLTPPNSATRKIKAFPFIMYDTARDCTNQEQSCRISITRQVTVSSTVSFSVSDGKSSTISNSFGNNTSTGVGSINIEEVMNMVGASSSFAEGRANGGTDRLMIRESLFKTHMLQAGIAKSKEKAKAETRGSTSDISGQTRWNNAVYQRQTQEERDGVQDSWGRYFIINV